MTVNSNAASLPVLLREFNQYMSEIGYFEPNPVITVATSGGADSMALLLLANDWAVERKGKVISLTVDHCLRPESAQEAQQVSNWCKELSIEHHILRWEHESHPLSSIQASARVARYGLLMEYCRANNILHLLTAHHLNDQVETLFFRLARNSNIEGLSAMPAQTIMSGVRLLRPLLHIPKIRLIATLQNRRQQWIEDPSNQNPLYTRVHIRKQLAENPHEADIVKRAGHIASNLSLLRKLLEKNIASELTKCVEIYNSGFAAINMDEFNKMGSDTCLKALSVLTQTLSGSPYPPRSEKLWRLRQDISSGGFTSKRSFCGLLFEILPNRKIIIYREPNAVQGPVIMEPNSKTLWDKRFLLEYRISGTGHSPLCARALGSKGLAWIRKDSPGILRLQPPDRVLRNIPSLWILEELISAPHIKYMNRKDIFSGIKARARFYPVKPLAGSGFFVMNNPM